MAQVPATPAPTPELQDQIDQLNRRNALLEARLEFPEAPQDILERIPDPTAMKATAKQLHDMAIAAKTPPAPVAPPPGTAPPPAAPPVAPPAGGGAVPIPGAGGVTPPQLTGNREYEELKFKVENKTATDMERDNFFKMALRGDSGVEGWNPHMLKLSERPGRKVAV